jgi:hypothetical protein
LDLDFWVTKNRDFGLRGGKVRERERERERERGSVEDEMIKKTPRNFYDLSLLF